MEYLILVVFLLLVIAYLCQMLYVAKKDVKEVVEEAAKMLNENDEQWTEGQEDLVEMYEMTLLTEREKYEKLDQEFNDYRAGIKKVSDEIERDIALWEHPDDAIQNSPSDGDIHG